MMVGRSCGVEHKQRATAGREENKVFQYLYTGQVRSWGAIDRGHHTDGYELPTRTKSDQYVDPNGQRGKMHSCPVEGKLWTPPRIAGTIKTLVPSLPADYFVCQELPGHSLKPLLCSSGQKTASPAWCSSLVTRNVATVSINTQGTLTPSTLAWSLRNWHIPLCSRGAWYWLRQDWFWFFFKDNILTICLNIVAS